MGREVGMLELRVATATVLMGTALGLLSEPACALAKTRCPGGRFVVQGGPLLPGSPAAQRDVVTLAADNAALSIGCGAEDLKGAVKLRPVKRATKVRAVWHDCGGLTGTIRLRGAIVADCARLKGTLRAKGVKKTLDAALSACGDGFVDPERGEACETGIACPGSAPCAIDCTCIEPTTTTSTPATTTSTTTVPGTCNVLAPPAAQGCAAAEKCTWVVIVDTPDEIGALRCVPDGTQDLDDSCTQGPAGESTGFDDCKAGLVCVGGSCHDVCGFDGSAQAACAAGSNCTRYAGLFANGDEEPVAGACQLGCNPVTQLRGDSTPCPAGQGCYLLTSSTDTIGVCASAGTRAHGELITGPAFANSCLPGHQPRLRAQGSSEVECGALCQPTDVYDETNEASEGGVSPYTCASKGAQPPSDPTSGESCRYWWARESTDTVTPYSNTVGWCFKHAAFQYDTDGDMVPDAPFPRCIDLTTGDVVPPIGNPPHNDAEYFWCVALPSALPPPALGTVSGWR